jgi:ABC-type phosphate/phosphonate transport system substrate-binding protein
MTQPVCRRRSLLAAAAAWPWAAATRAQGAVPVRVGLAPYLSPTALMAAFRPLREQLAAALAQPVELFTAADFLALARAVRGGDYDIAMLPAHLGWLALTDWGWHPLARTLASTEVLVLVRDDGAVQAPADLRGRRVGTLALLSLTSAVARRWLAAQGLDGPDGATVQTLPSINSALIALDRGEVDAVAAAATQLTNLQPRTPRAGRVLARLGDILGPVFIGRPDAPAATLARWRDALQARRPDPSAPRSAANSQPMPLEREHLAAMASFGEDLRRALAGPR